MKYLLIVYQEEQEWNKWIRNDSARHISFPTVASKQLLSYLDINSDQTINTAIFLDDINDSAISNIGKNKNVNDTSTSNIWEINQQIKLVQLNQN